MPTPQDIANYLLSPKCSKVIAAEPVIVTIKGKTYPAARYTERLEYPSGCRMITDGNAKPGDTYDREAIYVVGHRPANSDRSCFTIPGETHEWYISGYHGGGEGYVAGNRTPAPALGAFFLLMPWDVDGKIDQYEQHPYKRVNATVEPA